MTGEQFTWMAAGLALAFAWAARRGWRGGDEPRDVRLMLGTGAGFSGLAALLHVAGG